MLNCLYVNKPKGLTSFDVCFKLRKVLNTKKIGHTGTLDPNATGVMVILYDSSTKLNQFLVSDTKEYICEVLLGIRTDTLDIDGEIIEKKDTFMPKKEALNEVLNSFIGESLQTPPLTSAISVNGKRLYQYKKDNQEVEIPKRLVNIYEIELLDINEYTFTFRSKVSSGTYIRSLVKDILDKLNIIGTVKELQRTKIDNISLEECDKLEDIISGTYKVHNCLDILKNKYETINLIDPRLAINGRRLKLNTLNDTVLITSNNEAIAIYQKDNDEYKCIRGLR